MPKHKIKNRSITDFFKEDYIIYVKYTLEQRAIPSIIDGLKNSYRKSLHASLSFMKKGVSVSGLEIVGETYKKSSYHHGNSSLEDVVTQLGASFSNNTAPLVVNGSGGDLRNTDASSIRYLKFTLSEMADLYNVDLDILEYNYDGDKKIEPKFYLPIIPLVLASRASGVATGFAFANNMSFSVKSLAECVLAELENIKRKRSKELPKLMPQVNGYDGEFIEKENWKYETKGSYKIKGKKIEIVGLPIEQTYDSFEKNLSSLVEKGKILTFINEPKPNQPIRYVVQMNQSDINNLTKKDNSRLEKLLKISSVSNANVYTFLDENGNIKTDISNPHEVVRYFTNYRLSRYKDRKKVIIKNLKEKINTATDLSRFIDLVVKGKLELRNRPIKEIKEHLKKENISLDVLLVRVTRLTKEEYDKLLKEIKSLEKELSVVQKTTIENMYKKDLKELIKRFS